MSNSPYITEVTAATFEQEVLQKSMQVPVLVDFWADWCNPCKMLMPMLAQLAEEYQGKFLLAKVNTDVERDLAAAHGIRSLPTVRVFKQGEIAEEFNGVIPEAQIREVIERHILREEDFILQDGLSLLENGAPEQALTKLQQAQQINPDNKRVVLGLAKAQTQLGHYADAEELLKSLGMAYQDQPEVQELHAQLTFAAAAGDATDLDKAQASADANPKDCAALYKLGALQAMHGNHEAALEAFLQVMLLDRKFNDDAGRKAMLAVFDLLGGTGPLVNRYRVKMASALH